MSAKPIDPTPLSIGMLSAATGVPVDTLRTWERRYGFPAPVARTEGSHRRYAADTVEVIRLVLRALELGYRASAVVGLGADALRQLIQQAPGAGVAQEPARDEHVRIDRWLALTERFEADALSREFQRGLAEMPVLEFLERCMGPFFVSIGEAWSEGRLRVSHEHFASEAAREFMSGHWRRLGERPPDPGQPTLVLATPPHERHVLGLHMAAWVVALAGAQVAFLGADTPMNEVAFAVERHGATGVALSVASGYDADHLERELRALARRLPEHVRVAVGGSGATAVLPSVRRMTGLNELSRWVEQLRSARPVS